jgi:hypothetical protein
MRSPGSGCALHYVALHCVALCITLTVVCRTFAAPCAFSIKDCHLFLCCALVETLDAAQSAVYSGGPQPSERCVTSPATDRDRFCASRFRSSSQAVLPHPDSVSRIYPRPRAPSASALHTHAQRAPILPLFSATSATKPASKLCHRTPRVHSTPLSVSTQAYGRSVPSRRPIFPTHIGLIPARHR